MHSTPLAASAAERRTAARLGGALFRARSWLPVPFLVLALVIPASTGPREWIAGVLLVALGECIRIAGVAAAGTVTRRRSRNVQRLVTYGAFAWVRNPLYVGNFCIWLGVVAASGVRLLMPIAVLVFVIEYTLIVCYEEGVLESTFGAEYLAYKAITPRWIPRRPRAEVRGPHDWGEAVRSERSTFLQYAVIATAFAIKWTVLRGISG